MPQNISVVIIDSDIESINNIVKHGDRKLSLRVKLRGEAEANSEIRRFGRKNLRNLAFAMRLPRSKRPRNDTLCKEIETMKTCPFCKGDVESRKISHLHKWGNEYSLFENVLAEVCRQCGEVFFLPETLKIMDDYVRGKKSSEKTICIPVIKMPDMAVACDLKQKKGYIPKLCNED